ncbi:C4-dicarboxylate ABC transporter [Psychromonas sp. psych-6C06]|uniref:TRAP transporter permease n=1 Tax=Psychromonas sp. psych-6C06 TaxID=2058089 RepID=UPI000C32B260|nr:TRAP transporter permease [Psychromonas sp. psych-6C06]PKF63544.1 C4-dicarboxylate ABC transporter [Psychromonas sp. psych-6C06]
MREQIHVMNDAELQELVEQTETGGRHAHGKIKLLISITAIAWSLFQLYFSSPLPFILQQFLNNLGLPLNVVFDDTKARSIHLAFALFLAFLSYPAFKSSNKDRIPTLDWILALFGAFLGGYYFIFYDGLVNRIGIPNQMDLIAGVAGILILLEATRRSLGAPLAVIALIFLAFNFMGPNLPQLLAHNANKITTIVNQQWITTEGVFGIALGVSTKFVFLFVLFGALLDKAGAGNYFIKTAFSLLGHLRGGPAKAAVIASGLTGLISGSSIANVVTTGTFTIPMMKKVGFSSEKSGAVEVASSVNGQIMPPVMGAAAFLMVEYVGISYFEVVKHAIIPALISYIALVYIVHLEAMKAGMHGLQRAKQPPAVLIRLRNAALIVFSFCLLALTVYFGLGWIKTLAGDASVYVISVLIATAYIAIAYWCAKFPELELEDANAPIVHLPPVKETVNSGLHFLLPVIVLIWCLMIERLSPGTSAFWGTAVLIVILLTQKALFAYFRGETKLTQQWKAGVKDLFDGLEIGAKNMISIGIATATAGIIVGVVALTNVGAPLASIVEMISGGNILLMLIFVGVLSLILGMGLPTTANYIVVSSLLATVIVQVGQQNGLIVPLIAVHLFVFYFGIMADVTPPVGLASFAAAAISGGKPIKTSVIAFFYSLRTAILPFLFIFNTDLLLIDVSWLEGIGVFIIATLAILVFTAATQKFFFDNCSWLEVMLMIVLAFALFRPGYFMEKISPSYVEVEPYNIVTELDRAFDGNDMKMKVSGLSDIGDPVTFYVHLPIKGETGKARLEHMGLTIIESDGKMMIDDVAFDSPGAEMGLDWDQTILSVEMPVDGSLAKQWLYIPTLLLLWLMAFLQIRRRKAKLVKLAMD